MNNLNRSTCIAFFGRSVFLISGKVSFLFFLSLFLLWGCQEPNTHTHETMLRERIEKPVAPPALQQAHREENKADRSLLPSEPIDLGEAIAIGLSQSPRLKAAQTNTLIAKEGIQISRSAFLPQLSMGGNYYLLKNDINLGEGPLLENQFWQAELDLQWMLWDFGRTLGRYQQSQIAHEISQTSYHRFQQSLIYEISQSYYNILRAQKAKKIATDSLKATRMQLKTATNLFAQAQVTKDDVLRAEVLVAKYEQSMIQADNAIKLTLSALNRAMGIHINWPTAIQDTKEQPTFEKSLNWALEQAISHRPEFEQVQLGIALQESGLTATQGEYLPKLFVSSSLMHIQDQGRVKEDSVMGSLGIEIDLYTSGRRGAQTRQAKYKISQAIDKAREVCDTISFEVKQAYLGIKDAEARLPVAEKALSSATENARLVQEKYRNSLATATAVADSEAARTETHQAYYRALYDLMSAIERLHFAMGTNDILHEMAPEKPQ